MPRYETYSKVKEIYNISSETIRNWAKRGQIRYKCVQNATRKTWLYDVDSIGEYLQECDPTEAEKEEGGPTGSRVIYVRVSSAKQSADLTRQRELLQSAFPDASVVSDIASGLNFHRRGLSSLVRQICRDQVSQVVVTYRDRIARFGYELFELLCKEHGCSILVYGEGDEPEPEQELKDDLLAVVNVFVASHNGKRAAILRRKRKEAQAASEGHDHGSSVPDFDPDQEVGSDDGSE